MTNEADDFYQNLPDNRKHKDIERMIEEGEKIKGRGQSGRDRSKKPDDDSESKFNGAAAAMSFLVPGLGQVYRGKVLAGLLFLFGAIVGWFMFYVPAIIVWIVGILHAGLADD